MTKDLFHGEFVRLCGVEPEALGQAFAGWNRNSEYQRLLNIDPAALWSAKKTKEWFEKQIEKDEPGEYFFPLRLLSDDRLIGFVGLWGKSWHHGEAYVSIGLGDQEDWGKGYGTDAMRLALNYAFQELNLRRVTLVVYSNNPRGIRSYEKAGFRLEGRLRQEGHRDGQYQDVLIMGILRSDWEDVKR